MNLFFIIFKYIFKFQSFGSEEDVRHGRDEGIHRDYEYPVGKERYDRKMTRIKSGVPTAGTLLALSNHSKKSSPKKEKKKSRYPASASNI